MAEPFLSELRIFSFNFPPKGWAFCNGQLLPINQNQALFSLLGTTYGGNGQTNFALPDLRGRIPMHWGDWNSLGNKSGAATHTLLLSQIPEHTHVVKASTSPPNSNIVSAHYWAAKSGLTPYHTTANIALQSGSVSNVGGSQAHNNLSPYLVLNICIALQGIFPSQN